ncbi:MAG TPA: AsmA-like C-terminal region-containing protein [Edaphocola sp.]|nr:AsmA-like C-terminal region-containing protein [Edaphocola sp.]
MPQEKPDVQQKNSEKARHKWLKALLILFGSILFLLITGWFILSAYIQKHKQQILSDITEKINDHISGRLEIKDMKPALLNSFPNISVQLDSVILVDSQFERHHIKTAALQSIYVQINLLSLLSAHPNIRKITLHHGKIELFTLANGYSNSYLFHSRSREPGQKPNRAPSLHLFSVENVELIILHQPHHKRFDLNCNYAKIKLKRLGNEMHISSDLSIFVRQLGFNLAKGSYLQDKEVSGNLQLTYNTSSHQLGIRQQQLKINRTKIHLSALFDFGQRTPHFELRLKTPAIDYNTGLSLLPQSISKKLSKIAARNPVSVAADLYGGWQYPDTPLVRVSVDVRKNHITSPYGDLTNATFLAYFNNHLQPGKGKGDNNSGIFIPHFKGEWMDMPVQADSVRLNNLINPQLQANIKGQFPASKLNRLVGHSFAITSGDVQFDLSYNGPLAANDTQAHNLQGFLLVKDAALTYLPRALKFSHCNAALVFQHNNMLIKTMQLSLGKNSNIALHGKAENFLSAYFSDNKIADINCQLNSPKIDLNDFVPLLTSRQGYKRTAQARHRRINDFNQKIDNILSTSALTLHMNIQNLVYHKFKAGEISAQVTFDQNGIAINHTTFTHAGGRVSVDGTMEQSTGINDFTLNTQLNNLNINKLFEAFDNFNQDALKAQNLKGEFSANIRLKGKISAEAGIVPGSLNGNIDFTLNHGQLNNFTPFVSLSKFVFKSRNLDSITFGTLKNDLIIDHGKVYIPPMNILSSAISITIQGVYGFQHGTDISLEIPLRNPQKDKERIAQGLKPKRNKGLIVYLRATEGKDGKVHIGWDPLHKKRLEDSAQSP